MDKVIFWWGIDTGPRLEGVRGGNVYQNPETERVTESQQNCRVVILPAGELGDKVSAPQSPPFHPLILQPSGMPIFAWTPLEATGKEASICSVEHRVTQGGTYQLGRVNRKYSESPVSCGTYWGNGLLRPTVPTTSESLGGWRKLPQETTWGRDNEPSTKELYPIFLV